MRDSRTQRGDVAEGYFLNHEVSETNDYPGSQIHSYHGNSFSLKTLCTQLSRTSVNLWRVSGVAGVAAASLSLPSKVRDLPRQDMSGDEISEIIKTEETLQGVSTCTNEREEGARALLALMEQSQTKVRTTVEFSVEELEEAMGLRIDGTVTAASIVLGNTMGEFVGSSGDTLRDNGMAIAPENTPSSTVEELIDPVTHEALVSEFSIATSAAIVAH